VSRLDAQAPHEVILVLDAGIGQNAISQAKEFDAAIGVTGYVITKLDGYFGNVNIKETTYV
jgi:fused signal recognition particle receptor